MGCDIWLNYEVKTSTGWELHDWKAKYQTGQYSDGSPMTDWHRAFNDHLYVGRNYDLFAILANVRNGRGFAGIATGEGFEPISLPRGLPDDVTPAVKALSDYWAGATDDVCDSDRDGDGVPDLTDNCPATANPDQADLDGNGHSHSWLTLAEVMEYDYQKVTTQYGVVDREQYKVFTENGKPTSWCGDVCGSRVRKVSEAVMREIIDGGMDAEPESSYYTTVSWKETYRAAIGESWFAMLEYLKSKFGVENVRLVFWFDN